MKNTVRVLGVLGLLVTASSACDDDSSGSGSDAGGNAVGDGGPGGAGGTGVGGTASGGAGGTASGGTASGGAGGTVSGGAGGTLSASCGNAAAPCPLTVGVTFSGKGVGEGDGFFTLIAPEAGTYTLTFTGPPFGNVNFDLKIDGEWAFLCDISGGVNAPCCTVSANATTCELIVQSAERTALVAGQPVRIHTYAPGGASYSVKVAKKT